MSIELPKWARVTVADIEKLDLGIKYKPLTDEETADGMFARGPLVAVSTESTSAEVRKALPVPCHNLQLRSVGKQWYLLFMTNELHQRTVPIHKFLYVTPKNRLRIVTVNHGPIDHRALKFGDKSLYLDGIRPEAASVDDIVKDVWDGEWFDGS